MAIKMWDTNLWLKWKQKTSSVSFGKPCASWFLNYFITHRSQKVITSAPRNSLGKQSCLDALEVLWFVQNVWGEDKGETHNPSVPSSLFLKLPFWSGCTVKCTSLKMRYCQCLSCFFIMIFHNLDLMQYKCLFFSSQMSETPTSDNFALSQTDDFTVFGIHWFLLITFDW